MIDPLFDGDDTANTPLTQEEREQLVPTYISLRAELNEAEQVNITQAARWLARTRKTSVLDDRFLRELHRRMFRDVWRWAGRYRLTARNIGIEAYRIPTEVRALVGTTRYWVEHKTFEPNEIALRFGHQLVSIHPFPNGNGRHSRLATDLMAIELGVPRFTWGRSSLVDAEATRKAYVTALQAADGGDIAPLMLFART